ncbi:MAG: response regulator, partial [Anaerolineales bacterium]|nr:response regulator [Anaerolineales bacterium]
LIIESDEATRGAICDLLQLEWPYLSMYTADSGESGVRVAQQKRPDLILVGSDLPGMNGYQTARTLRQMPETTLTPLVAITSSTFDRSQLMASLCSTCNAWLLKPFSAQRLIQIIRPFALHLPNLKQGHNSYLHS